MGKYSLLALAIYMLIGYGFYILVPLTSRLLRWMWAQNKTEYKLEQDRKIDQIESGFQSSGIALAIVYMLAWLPIFVYGALHSKKK